MPRYSRAVPPEWQNLLEATHSQLGERLGPNMKDTLSVYGQLDQLGDETLAVNKYYGLGLVMCGLARRLGDRAIRDQVVEDAVTCVSYHILANTEDDRTDVAIVKYMQVAPLTQPLIPIAQRAIDELSPATHFLIDALTGVAERREKAHILDEPLSGMLTNAYILDSIRNGTAATTVIAANALAASNLVMRCVVDQLGPGVTEDADQPSRSRPTAAEFQQMLDDSDSTFEDDLDRVMLRSAGIRIDEINNAPLMRELVAIDKKGILDFQRCKLPQEPPLLPAFSDRRHSHIVIHSQRLRCPSVHVEGLIPLVTRLVPEIMTITEAVVRPYFSGRVSL